MKQKTE